MSAPPVVLRRSARNSAKRTSPTAETTSAAAPEAAAPAPKKKRTAPAAPKEAEEKKPKEKKPAVEKKPAAEKAPAEKKAPAVKKAAATVKKAIAAVVPATVAPVTEEKMAAAPAEEEPTAPVAAASAPAAVAVAELKEGDSVPDNLPEFQIHTGETTTLTALIAASEKGIVIFAYPKASTPGCTTQACAFRDNTTQFSGLGYAVYGLSGDSPSANDKFHTKQNLSDIKLLCDPKYELHARLGVKKAGAAKGTVRSVVVIKKDADGKATVVRKTPANPAQSVDIAIKAINAATTEKKDDEDSEMKD